MVTMEGTGWSTFKVYDGGTLIGTVRRDLAGKWTACITVRGSTRDVAPVTTPAEGMLALIRHREAPRC